MLEVEGRLSARVGAMIGVCEKELVY
jgi:hypothetical protein